MKPELGLGFSNSYNRYLWYIVIYQKHNNGLSSIANIKLIC